MKTREDIPEFIIEYYNKRGIDVDSLTCIDCEGNEDCEFAFDPYNTDGDCLRMK